MNEIFESPTPEAAVQALHDASRRLLLPVDVDQRFHALIESDLDDRTVVREMKGFLRARAVEGGSEK